MNIVPVSLYWNIPLMYEHVNAHTVIYMPIFLAMEAILRLLSETPIWASVSHICHLSLEIVNKRATDDDIFQQFVAPSALFTH